MSLKSIILREKKSDSRNYILNDSIYTTLWKWKKIWKKKSDQWLPVAGGGGREFTTKNYEELFYISILVVVT